ncbi:MAG: metallophosphoesterase family protein [Gammaproteobacteria bacterium]|nr:metallophosphoesterase family protein [Gammaproteobacteria bacterium]
MKRSYRVLLLADTHATVHPEIVALAHSADHVVHAGDIGHPDVLDRLRGDRNQVVAVRGNNDTAAKWPADRLPMLDALHNVAGLALPGGAIAIEHGHCANPATQRHDILRRRHADARLIVYGHSHRQVIDDTCEPWVVNPGAAGRNRSYGGSGCILLEASSRRWKLQAFQFALSDWKK